MLFSVPFTGGVANPAPNALPMALLILFSFLKKIVISPNYILLYLYFKYTIKNILYYHNFLSCINILAQEKLRITDKKTMQIGYNSD